jgi:hypothetical protein
MRAIYTLGASVAALVAQPAEAAIWFLKASGTATGTSVTVEQVCGTGEPSDCFITTTAPATFKFQDTFLFDESNGSIQPYAFGNEHADLLNVAIGTVPVFNATLRGTVEFLDGQFFGRDLIARTESDGRECWTFPCSYSTISASAPTFAVTFIESIDGPPPVPEPATWATMRLGFGLLGAGMRRSRQSDMLPVFGRSSTAP